MILSILSAIRHPLAISCGAIAGALTRYYLTLWFARRFGDSFPYGTFFINLTGCLSMGFFLTLSLEQIVRISPEIRLLIAVGFLGSYTTFSTYGFDSLSLINSRKIELTLLYWLGSAVFGVIFAQIGVILARSLK